MISRIAIVMTLATLSACSDEQEVTITPTSPTGTLQPVAPPPPPALPPANFSEKDGDVYLYTTAVSEEDQKKGRATGDVVGFKFKGDADGVYRLAVLNDADREIGSAECRRPCSVITYRYNDGSKDRVAFSDNSVIGSAFLDAFNGHLKQAKAKQNIAKRMPSPTSEFVENTEPVNSEDDPYVPVTEE
jgi:hypothetical protein